MPLIKPRELGGKIVGIKDHLPRPSSLGKLSSYNEGINYDEDYESQEGSSKGRLPIMVKIKDTLPRRLSYVKLSSNDTNEDDEQQEGTPKGHVPVMVGKEEGQLKRFVVPTKFMKDPSIVTLLKLSADEFGFDQQGVVQIPCEHECFEKIIKRLSKNKR